MIKVSPEIFYVYVWLLKYNFPAYMLRRHINHYKNKGLVLNHQSHMWNMHASAVLKVLGPTTLKDWLKVLRDKIFGEKEVKRTYSSGGANMFVLP